MEENNLFKTLFLSNIHNIQEASTSTSERNESRR